LDIGSRTIKLVVLDSATHRVISSAREDTTPYVDADCRRLLDGAQYDRLVVTGYGRAMAEIQFDARSVTEIKAFARGAASLLPDCRTVLDIGGQDTKAISLSGSGRVAKFEMNDRCAAGAGKFLEIMAKALDYDLKDFGAAALQGRNQLQLSSMCAVFAESEVIGLMTRGAPREDVAQAVHRAVVERTLGMLRRLGPASPIMFAGGAAGNPCLVTMLRESLGKPIHVPKEPQMVGALGAALLASEDP
jgi:predicted CoA-substrate-specific enzyme activase